MITAKYLIVLAIVFGLGLAPRLWRARHARLAADTDAVPPLPTTLRDPAAHRTYVIFTTRWCATCGPVEARLRAEDPDGHFVTVDAEAEPQLAARYRIRTAPTVLVADARGVVLQRLVGPAAAEQLTR
jgi:hypothetical protein